MKREFSISQVDEVVRYMQHLKGKYVKQTLTALEKSGKLDSETRKAVLDNFNEFSRSIYKSFGYTVEE